MQINLITTSNVINLNKGSKFKQIRYKELYHHVEGWRGEEERDDPDRGQDSLGVSRGAPASALHRQDYHNESEIRVYRA